MMKEARDRFALTPQGADVLRGAPSVMDDKALKILSLFQHGETAWEVLLPRSKLPRDQLIEALRVLVAGGLVVAAAGNAPAKPVPPVATSPAAPAAGANALRGKFGLRRGVSPSQARFILSNFCLDQFGTGGQALAEVIELCTDVSSLQQAVNNVRSEVEKRIPDKLPLLIACVKEINETDF